MSDLSLNTKYKVYKDDSPFEMGTFILLQITDTILIFDKNLFIFIDDIGDYSFKEIK